MTRAEPGRGQAPEEGIRIGVSSCLLGQRVRYDGGHKRDDFVGLLARFVTLVPVCPEVELGLGVPREPIRLERRGGLVRLVAPESGKDHSEAMRRYAESRVAELERLGLSGYILKKDSPSCGMERVRVWGRRRPGRTGRGAFAAVLLERLPLLPVQEEGRLHSLPLRECFVERVFAYRRVRSLLDGRGGVAALVRFHAAEKLLLLAHDPAASRRLDRLVARAERTSRGGSDGGSPRGSDLARRYAETYMDALARPASRGRHGTSSRIRRS